MYYIAFFVFSLNILIYLLEMEFKLNNRAVNFIFIILFTLLASFVSYNIYDLSRDVVAYEYWMKVISNTHISVMLFEKDPLFQIIVYLIQFFNNSIFFIYFIFVFLILSFKYKFSELILNRYNALILFWLIFAQTFTLYEVTQIRAGLAISLASYAIISYFSDSNRNKFSILLLFLSCFIHASLTVLVIFFVVANLLRNIILNRVFVIITLFSSLIFGFIFKTYLQNYINLKFSDNDRFEDYLNKNADDLSLFSVFLLMKILMIFLNTVFWRELNQSKKLFVLLSAIGCSLQIMFNFNAVLGLRFSEVFILFSLATFIFPLEYKSWDKGMKSLYFLLLIVLSFMFFYSSNKILL
ncbi:EpsG family protein [Acinetobacter johnsonii]|uniref:EpsG family protein n=1 Tax=Acinetobacter johnsonii TaxID=40214 RepID=UPI002447FEB1|nr:EpsG family protein [Acinetobacter johnsonii]MDH1240702.1 EpsG family protein [Acinetobacter johnsonii]